MDNILLRNNNIEFDLDKRQQEINIKIQARNGKKCITIVEGLCDLEMDIDVSIDVFLDDIANKFKKKFNCGATIKKPENVIQLSGDHRHNIKKVLVENNLVKSDQVKIHGY